MGVDPVALSRAVSHALRHEPEAYSLQPDEQGWVEVDDLLRALRAKEAAWTDLTAPDLAEMIDGSSKRRHELDGTRIRATYGHSTPDPIVFEPGEPPLLLYHGTTRAAVPLILAQGLERRARQYVHLSGDVQTARVVGSRRDRAPVIIEVLAQDAHRAGVRFFPRSDAVWLADSVPPRFLRRVDEP